MREGRDHRLPSKVVFLFVIGMVLAINGCAWFRESNVGDEASTRRYQRQQTELNRAIGKRETDDVDYGGVIDLRRH